MAGASGLGLVAQAAGYGMPAAQQSYSWLDNIILQAKQAQINRQVMQKLAAMQQGQPQTGTTIMPQQPSATSAPAAVSPPVGGTPLAATGGAPGGAAPIPNGVSSPGGGVPPQMPTSQLVNPTGGQPMPQVGGMQPTPQIGQPGILGQLLQAYSGATGDPRAISGSFQDMSKTLAPAQNQATRIEIAGQNEAGRNARAALSSQTRLQIATQNGELRTQLAKMSRQNSKLKDDPEFRAMEDELKAAQSANTASPTDDNLQAVNTAAKNLLTYAKSLAKENTGAPSSKPAASAEAPAAGGAISVVDPQGNPGTIPADQLKDALAQGYKQAQ